MANRSDPLAHPASPRPVVHFVEDDHDARQATARLLTTAGHIVRSYASAAEFLAAMPISEPGCVVLDVELPDANGLELQARRSRRPRTSCPWSS